MERHNNFDLMRLLAAASVILSHAFLLAENSQAHDPLMILTGGQTILGLAGVFAFFTISGYLISQSFEATPSPWQFLAKRALRIFPGLVACLAVCAFVVGPLVSRLGPAAYFARPEPYLFVAHNAVLDVEFNRLPGVEFWAGNIGGIVNGPLWSLPCEAILYLILFALGRLRLLVLPVTLIMLAVGIVCLWFDTSGSTFGSVFWLMGLCAAWGVFVPIFPLCGSYLVLYLALERRLPAIPAARFGDLSYGLYIYGWPVEQCVVYFSGGRAAWGQVFGIAAVVTPALAFASWHLVEKRCRLGRRRLAPAGAAAD